MKKCCGKTKQLLALSENATVTTLKLFFPHLLILQYLCIQLLNLFDSYVAYCHHHHLDNRNILLILAFKLQKKKLTISRNTGSLKSLLWYQGANSISAVSVNMQLIYPYRLHTLVYLKLLMKHQNNIPRYCSSVPNQYHFKSSFQILWLPLEY